MEGVQGGTQVGSMRAFITNGGPHSAETLAEMTYCQLFSPAVDGTGIATEAIIKAALQDMHEGLQSAVRTLLQRSPANKETYDKVFQIILKDLATSMENERSYHKE